MSLGYSHDVTSKGNPHNNKLKYKSELIHVYKKCQQKWHSNCQKVANMGVTDVIVTIFDDVFEVCFLTENNYCFFMADLIASVADVIATC